MNHLAPDEFADLVEGRLAAARAAHVASCAACRDEAAAVRSALLAARAVNVPEPSPLFWDHFSARVRERLADGPEPASVWWRPRVAALAGVLAVLLLAVVLNERPIDVVGPANLAQSMSQTDVASTRPDPAWDVLTTLVEQAPAETGRSMGETPALGFSVRPATVDRAVEELNSAEREELGRLLQDELKRSGA